MLRLVDRKLNRYSGASFLSTTKIANWDIFVDSNFPGINSIEDFSDLNSGPGTGLLGSFSDAVTDYLPNSIWKKGVNELQEIVKELDKLEAGKSTPSSRKGLTSIYNFDKVERAYRNREAFRRSTNTLSKAGSVARGAGGAYGAITGGLDIAAGLKKIEQARLDLKNGDISQDEYERAIRQADTRTAVGATRLARDTVNLAEVFVEQLSKLPKYATKSGVKTAARWVPVVGSAAAIAYGVASVTNNAMAAEEAFSNGNIGRGAMYVVGAVIDGVCVVLDSISLVADFFPPVGTVVSLILDAVSTGLSLLNDLILAFTEFVDTREESVKLTEEFDKYISSEPFTQHVDKLFEHAAMNGFDTAVYATNAEAAGITHGDSTDRTAMKKVMRKEGLQTANRVNRRIKIALYDEVRGNHSWREVKHDNTDQLVQLIISDGVGKNNIYTGHGDDVLIGNSSSSDNLFTLGGNDVVQLTDGDRLESGPGDDTVLAGPGDDFININTGSGNDYISIPSGMFTTNISESYINGRSGNDTLEIPYRPLHGGSPKPLNIVVCNAGGIRWYDSENWTRDSSRQSPYVRDVETLIVDAGTWPSINIHVSPLMEGRFAMPLTIKVKNTGNPQADGNPRHTKLSANLCRPTTLILDDFDNGRYQSGDITVNGSDSTLILHSNENSSIESVCLGPRGAAKPAVTVDTSRLSLAA